LFICTLYYQLSEGADGLPFFDSLDSLDGISAEDIDLILITHFHIDHCAALPYFTEKVFIFFNGTLVL